MIIAGQIYILTVVSSYLIIKHMYKEIIGKVNKQGYELNEYRIKKVLAKGNQLAPLNKLIFIPIINLVWVNYILRNKEQIKTNIIEYLKETTRLRPIKSGAKEYLGGVSDAKACQLNYLYNQADLEKDYASSDEISCIYRKIDEINQNDEINEKEKLKLLKYYLEELKNKTINKRILKNDSSFNR